MVAHLHGVQGVAGSNPVSPTSQPHTWLYIYPERYAVMVTTTPSEMRGAVSNAIDEGRVGTPKFLRCIAQTAGPEGLDVTLNDLLSLAEVCFGASPTKRHDLTDGSGTYLSEMVKWDQGQSAILTVAPGPANAPETLDLMLVGSRGALYNNA